MSFNIFSGTFNVNAKLPSDDLHLWLFPKINSELKISLYSIGLQEVRHFSPDEDPLNFHSTPYDVWIEKILSILNEKDAYSLLNKIIYSSLMLIVIVKTNILNPIRISFVGNFSLKLHDSTETGKKGLCGIEVEISNSKQNYSLALMTSHFQADEDKFNDRINDSILCVDCAQWPSGKKTTEHDFAILAGDLNFRIHLNNELVKSYIDQGKFKQLLSYDELVNYSDSNLICCETKEKPEKLLNDLSISPIFSGWNESLIEFLPTYKYTNGTNNWDSSEKKRTPSWCDRIINWGAFENHGYSSIQELNISDHKPVYSVLSIKI